MNGDYFNGLGHNGEEDFDGWDEGLDNEFGKWLSSVLNNDQIAECNFEEEIIKIYTLVDTNSSEPLPDPKYAIWEERHIWAGEINLDSFTNKNNTDENMLALINIDRMNVFDSAYNIANSFKALKIISQEEFVKINQDENPDKYLEIFK